MAAHPASRRSTGPAHPHADGGNLVAADPDAREVLIPFGLDAVADEGADNRLLQTANVGLNATGTGTQADDRVGDKLAGAVEGDVAAAVYLQQGRAERLGGDEETVAVHTAAGGVDRRVLQQEQRVLDLARGAADRQLALQRPGLLVADPAQPASRAGRIALAHSRAESGP